jgi:hypothetical protein
MATSFDLGPGGSVTPRGERRDLADLSSSTLRVVHDDGDVSVYALVGGKPTRVAEARVRGHRLYRRRSLREPIIAWAPIATKLGELIDRAPMQGDGRGRLVDRLEASDADREPRSRQPRTRRSLRVPLIAAGVFGGFGAVCAYRIATFGANPLSAAILLGGLVGGWLLFRGLSILSSAEALNEPETRDSDGKRQPGPIARGGLLRVTFGGMGYAIAVIGLISMRPVRPTMSSTAAGSAATSPSGSASAAAPTIDARVASAPDLATAVALATPAFTDNAADNARLVARGPLTWGGLARIGETSLALALKEPALERGKRICASGRVADIERQELAGRAVYRGVLTTDDGDAVRFVAAGSTGALVRRSPATFCGVVTGRLEEAAVAVGMFDLPENREISVERR